MNLLDPIVAWQDDITAIRRDLHAHPELAYEEHRTADTVAHWLTEWGIEVHRGLAGTGVVGTIKGNLGPGLVLGYAPTWMPYPYWNRMTLPTSAATQAKCTHVVTTATLLCCYLQHVT